MIPSLNLCVVIRICDYFVYRPNYACKTHTRT